MNKTVVEAMSEERGSKYTEFSVFSVLCKLAADSILRLMVGASAWALVPALEQSSFTNHQSDLKLII